MSKTQSVLILQPWLNYRGAETLSIYLNEDLNLKGYTSRLLCLFVTDAVIGSLDRRLLIVPPIFLQKILSNQLFFILFGFWVLLFYLFKHGRKFDVYNPHNFPTVWVAVIVGWVYRKRVVWTVHNFPQHPFRGRIGLLYEFIISPLDKFLAKGVGRIVAVSQKVKQEILQKYTREAFVVYPGLDIRQWKDFSNGGYPRVIQSLKGKRILLHVGQIRPEKNQQFTLRFFEKIFSVCPDLQLVFAGQQQYDFLNTIPSVFRERVTVFNTLSKQDLAKLYSIAEFLIHPSEWGEGCTLVPLEAMISGTAHVLVVKGCGADEVCERENVGFVFEGNQYDVRLEDYVLSAYEEPFKEEYGKISERYSRKVFVENYIPLLFE